MKRKVTLIRKIVCYTDAGYKESVEFAKENDVKVPNDEIIEYEDILLLAI